MKTTYSQYQAADFYVFGSHYKDLLAIKSTVYR